ARCSGCAGGRGRAGPGGGGGGRGGGGRGGRAGGRGRGAAGWRGWAEGEQKMYRATVTMPQPEEPVRGRPRSTRGRGTRQAQALAAALESLPGFCSAQEIHAELRRKGEHVGLATVYRHLQALSEQGNVDAS